jgi:large subunit ribosomal protein L16
VIKPGRIMFELEGVPEDIARKAFDLAIAKLPLKCRFVVREHAGAAHAGGES